MKWISTNEGMPKVDADALLLISGRVHRGKYSGTNARGYRWYCDEHAEEVDGEVTHWLPIPALPEK